MYLIEFILAGSRYSISVAINLVMLIIILVAIMTEAHTIIHDVSV